ncbi:MAG: hypothetical protein ACFB0G_00985 [Leptolyngbyaceae cyanobacterium]
MLRCAFLAIVWLVFVVYAFRFAPPDQPDTAQLIRQLSTGEWQELNPAVVALFNLMGLCVMSQAIVDRGPLGGKMWEVVGSA